METKHWKEKIKEEWYKSSQADDLIVDYDGENQIVDWFLVKMEQREAEIREENRQTLEEMTSSITRVPGNKWNDGYFQALEDVRSKFNLVTVIASNLAKEQ